MINRSPPNAQYASALSAPNVSCLMCLRWTSSGSASSLAAAGGVEDVVVVFAVSGGQHPAARRRYSVAPFMGRSVPEYSASVLSVADALRAVLERMPRLPTEAV